MGAILPRSDLLARLRRLDLWFHEGRGGVRTGIAGSLRGPGMEFFDHRPYTPGDDPRYMDWRLLARLRRPFVRRSEERAEGNLLLALDTSGSMGVGDHKLTTAVEMAAAIAYLALDQHGRVGLQLLGEPPSLLPMGRGRNQLPPILAALEGVEAGGRANLTAELLASIDRWPGPVHILLISDLLLPLEELRDLRMLTARGHHLDLLQILDEADTDPTLDGTCRLVDAEDGASLDTVIDPGAKRAYQHALTDHLRALRLLAHRHRMRHLRIDAATGMEEALLSYLTLNRGQGPGKEQTTYTHLPRLPFPRSPNPRT